MVPGTRRRVDLVMSVRELYNFILSSSRFGEKKRRNGDCRVQRNFGIERVGRE